MTEMITGVDLVREQIRIAAGLPLGMTQSEVRQNGHALECRINVEDPGPDSGPDRGHAVPSPARRTRCAGGHGAVLGCVMPPQYDSLAAKVVVHATPAWEAIRRMRRALEEVVIEGYPTTADLAILFCIILILSGQVRHKLFGAASGGAATVGGRGGEMSDSFSRRRAHMIQLKARREGWRPTFPAGMRQRRLSASAPTAALGYRSGSWRGRCMSVPSAAITPDRRLPAPEYAFGLQELLRAGGAAGGAQHARISGYEEKLRAARKATGLTEGAVAARGERWTAAARFSACWTADSSWAVWEPLWGKRWLGGGVCRPDGAAAGDLLRQRRSSDAGGNPIPDADG